MRRPLAVALALSSVIACPALTVVQALPATAAKVGPAAGVIRARQAPPEPVERPRGAVPPAPSSRPGAGAWLVLGAVGMLWLAGLVMAGAMVGQGVSTRAWANLAFGVVGVGIFAGLPIAVLSRTAVVLVPLALAGGAWGYLRQPLRAAPRDEATSDLD